MKSFNKYGFVLLIVFAGAASAQTLDQRKAAAEATAQSATNYCGQIPPADPLNGIGAFYWEIGDANAFLDGGTIPTTYSQPDQGHAMSIASASKWVYASYVAQRWGSAALTSGDIDFLTLSSGYHSYDKECDHTQTVDECLARGDNDTFTPADAGKFYYNSAHFEIHAASTDTGIVIHGSGMGDDQDGSIQSEIQNYLGNHGLSYRLPFTQPVLAAGVYTQPLYYAAFLRDILSGHQQMYSLLGTHAVCTSTNPAAACTTSLYTPVQPTESWHYSVGHWVEDDPMVGDGAFSSPGARGFYPWIDATKTWYGILARDVAPPPPQTDNDTIGFNSVQCGRQIRYAWVHGTPVTHN